VKARLTGLAQVNGLRGQPSLRNRVEWNNHYIVHWSTWLDVKILLKTVPALLAARREDESAAGQPIGLPLSEGEPSS
jgi:lipopolysaccharide/colanic/teichoic acid biosynthesis glycosyltransferase